MRATMSILGLYNYDETLFDNFQLPWYNTYNEAGEVSGTVVLDSSILVPNLCAELAELEVLYPNPDTMKEMIGHWSKKNVANWSKIFAAMEEKYDPLENYSRHDKFEHESGNQSGDSGNVQNTVSGYNTEELVNRDASRTGAEGWSHNEDTNIGYSHGNIGVTTSQRMLESEITLRRNNNVYDMIIEDFAERFCLRVY